MVAVSDVNPSDLDNLIAALVKRTGLPLDIEARSRGTDSISSRTLKAIRSRWYKRAAMSGKTVCTWVVKSRPELE